ncbi:MAG TPA: DUF58 domain-containing protein [Polyangiaceae bacterium]|nr:DUF58 domain-containing protein [Polyangiaceae bacterium]
MQVHPTRTSIDLAGTALVAVAAGLLMQSGPVVAWAGALLVGLALARAVTEFSVNRIRNAGFEMLWRGEARSARTSRGELLEIEAEVRNRDSRAARFVGLRAVYAPELAIEIVPAQGEVPAAGRLRVVLRVSGKRVGRYGIHGLSLEVQGNPGLYEVPLTFANPFGVEVMPRAYQAFAHQARGGRSHRAAEHGRPGPAVGDGEQLRELREHRSGDALRRVAWKATAKRGRLMVREYEREERDVVWFVLDASVELGAGNPGHTPLDRAIDEVSGFATMHAARGDRIGLCVVAARTLHMLTPDRGPTHTARMLSLLSQVATFVDADRSGLDEADVAARVLEHMRPLDPNAADRVRSSELERIARRADRLRQRAPFEAYEVLSGSRSERSLRRYLLAFGLTSPARLEPDRPRTDLELIRVLSELSRNKPRPSLIYVWSPTPDPTSRGALERALAHHARRRHELRWVPMRFDLDLERAAPGTSQAVLTALVAQARAAHERGAAALARLGIKLLRVRSTSRVGVALASLARIEHQHVTIDDRALLDLHSHVPVAEDLSLPK